jgi:hypothetical protein
MSTATARRIPDAWQLQGPLGPALRRGAWCALPVAFLLLLDLTYTSAVAGALSTGALLTGFVAFEAPARVRLVWQLCTAPLIGAAGALGVLTGGPIGLATVTMTVVAIAGGYTVAVSQRLYIAALNVVLGLLIAQGVHLSTSEAPEVLVLGCLGGWCQALFALIAWLAGDDDPEPLDIRGGAAGARAALAENLRTDSHAFRHALRWGVALGAGVAVYHLIDFEDHGYWVPLTTLFVLKPELGDTIERVLMRAAGTFAGLVVATGLAPLLMFHPIPDAIALGIAAAFALALLRIEYALFTFSVTVFIVLMADVMGHSAIPAAAERALGTTLGIAIAMAAILIWPSEPRRRREAAPA